MASDEFLCGFCLAIVEGNDYPDRCDRCEMVQCHECGTWLKERDGHKSKFCYGCGSLSPTTSARFNRTSNISCCYMEKSWKERNLGRECKSVHLISTGWKTVESKKNGDPISSWIVKEEGGKFIDVRELTEEEKALLKN